MRTTITQLGFPLEFLSDCIFKPLFEQMVM